MSSFRNAAGRWRAARVLVALAAATACLGAVVAYAATRSVGGHQKAHRAQTSERLWSPELIEAPPETTAASDPQIRFHVRPRNPSTQPAPGGPEPAEPETSTRRFQCRVDGSDWSACRSPYRLTGLVPGSHGFAVRVFNRENRAGEPVAISWQQIAVAATSSPPSPPPAPPKPDEPVAPKQFSIEALEEPENLYPGFPPTTIPVRIANPNSVPIEVTALSVAIGEAPAGCTTENFELTPAGVSPTEPVQVPANGSVDLPTATVEAPSIRMLNLPVNQDACQELQIPLVFSGEAQG
jgi:hypothetical protein